MILDTLAKSTKKRVELSKEKVPFKDIKKSALETEINKSFPFEKALLKEGMSYICEVKKASPSKGIIAENFPYKEIAIQYENAGASAISVLTEPEYFKGSNEYLKEISDLVNIPLLRKDFTVDSYQIYEAKTIGASAILLICALLDTDTIAKYVKICDELGLSALVEAHNEEEIQSAIKAGARIIGVNNRDLKTFTVDINNSVRLRNLVPRDIIFVAESGIKTNNDVNILKKSGVNAVLIGETFMRSSNKKAMLEELNGGAL